MKRYLTKDLQVSKAYGLMIEGLLSKDGCTYLNKYPAEEIVIALHLGLKVKDLDLISKSILGYLYYFRNIGYYCGTEEEIEDVCDRNICKQLYKDVLDHIPPKFHKFVDETKYVGDAWHGVGIQWLGDHWESLEVFNINGVSYIVCKK